MYIGVLMTYCVGKSQFRMVSVSEGEVCFISSDFI